MGKIKYFTQQELKKLFQVIEKSKDENKYWLRDLSIFRLAYRCGLRASEIGLIKLANYNRQCKEIYCQRLKGSQSNTIRLDDETVKILNKYIKEYNITSSEDILFRSQHNKPIDRVTLHHWMKVYCERAKILDMEKRHFHTLKHSCAVHLAEAGLDIKELQFFIGHKNVNNTLVYFQFTTKQQDAMYQKLKNNCNLV